MTTTRLVGLDRAVSLNQRQNISAERSTLPDSSASSDVVSGYDDAEVSRWYSGSACSGQGSKFVGGQPFFLPCRSDLESGGVATWGKHPYYGPFRYLDSSKNPYWLSNTTGQLRCLPYFYLVGVSKSGTTDLYFRLAQHPSVIPTRKEVHYFDRFRFRKGMSFEAYVNCYNRAASTIQASIGANGTSSAIVGDASPSYFYDNYYWKRYLGNENCTEPRVILAHHIYHLNPNVRIILIMRHPVYRLYSRYLFDHTKMRKNLKERGSPRQFHSFVVDALTKFRSCFRQWSLRHCIYNETLFRSIAYIWVQESLYPVLLEDWLRVVPRHQFLFLRFEDYARNTASHLRQAFDFLQLPPLTDAELERIAQIIDWKARNQGRLASKKLPMLPETERLLLDFYQPFVRRLAAMLNDKRFLWADLFDPPRGNSTGH